jgi:hypothetical protein
LRAALEHTPNLPDTLDEARGNFAAVDDLFHCSERPAVITRHEHEEIAIAVPTYDLRENPDARQSFERLDGRHLFSAAL